MFLRHQVASVLAMSTLFGSGIIVATGVSATPAYASSPPTPTPTAYVVNSGPGTVTPITIANDPANDTVGTAINVGSAPEAIAITSDGATAYVANTGSDNVSVIDTTAGTTNYNTVTATISVGSAPYAIAITPNGATAYVANSGSGTVSVIDTTVGTTNYNTVIATINVGSGPEAIAITPDGTTAYVANYGSGTVTPITIATNPANDTKGTPIPVGNNPIGIAITPNGATAYVVNTGSDNVSVIDTTAGTTNYNTVTATISVGSAPDAIAITPNGATAYVADYVSNTVTPITIATNPANDTTGTTITVDTAPDAIAITPDQAPVAALSVTAATVGYPSGFNASASTVSYGTIAFYVWSFGDGTTAITTTPTTTHAYMSAGTYTASVTETDSAGTSTSEVFTGQTMSNNGGPGAEATATLSVINGVPQVPTGLSAIGGNTQVLLTWTAPTSNGGAFIPDYDVYVGTTPDGESSTQVNTTTLTATSYTVTGLTNGTTYYFTVKAINAIGSSGASNEASATPATTPGAPTGLSATGGNAQVLLTWKTPSSDGGSAITSYDVYEWNNTTSSWGSPVGTTASTATSYTVTGLTNGTTYYLTVEAINAVGSSGAPSDASAMPAITLGALTTPSSGGGSGVTTPTPAPPPSGTPSGSTTILQSSTYSDIRMSISGSSGSSTATVTVPTGDTSLVGATLSPGLLTWIPTGFCKLASDLEELFRK